MYAGDHQLHKNVLKMFMQQSTQKEIFNNGTNFQKAHDFRQMSISYKNNRKS